jgi:chemotaxis protein MotB
MEEEKMRAVAWAIIGLPLLGGCVSQQKYDQEVKTAQTYQALEAQYQALNQQLQAEIKADQVQIKQLQNRLVVTFVDEVLFSSGSVELHSKGRAVLDKAVPTLTGLTGHWIDVQGYTDNEPIGPALKARYPTNWELSAARAAEVVRYLQAKGVDPRNLVAEGFGEYQPVASNATPEGRAKNRRIDLVLRSK